MLLTVCVCVCVLLCISPLSSSCSGSSRGGGGAPQDVFAWITNELFALSPDRQKNADFAHDRCVHVVVCIYECVCMCACMHVSVDWHFV